MRNLIATFCAATLFLVVAEAQAQNWPRFRGPDGNGVSDLKGVPSVWTINDYAFSIDLPGTGHASPVVWEKKLFVTSSGDQGERSLHCLDADTGKEMWVHSMKLGKNHLHKMNSYASGTPAVDAEKVYVSFADAEHYHVTAYLHNGDQAWTRDLGTCITEHGHGVSPVLIGDLVIVCNDQGKQEGPPPPSFVMALDRKTGATVWNIERKSREASYSTPLIINPPGKSPQLVVLSGANGMTGFDPLTGAEIWSTGELPKRTVGSPTYGSGMLVATCGQGGRGEAMICVEPMDRNSAASPLKYVRPKAEGVPYVPTPVIVGDRIFLWNDDGTFFLANLLDGKNVTRARIGGAFFSSPVLIDGKLFNVSQDGEVVVLSITDKEIKVEGKSPLGDSAYASPAVANGGVYFRGFKKVAFLKARS